MRIHLYTLVLSFFCIPGIARSQVLIYTLAGNGTAAYSGDGGAAISAEINNPHGVAVDAIGNVYFTDYGNNRVRKVDTFGVITNIAGTGTAGFSGDGGPATNARLNQPMGIAVDAAGNVYFSDYLHVRKVDVTGTITSIAGTGLATFSGDGGPASAAAVNYPWGIAVDASNNIYIADQLNCRVRKIDASGNMSTITGTGSCFIGGDGGPASSARVQYPIGVACDASGNIYIADNGNNRVRKINSSGIISTVAGSASFGFTGDGGPSTAAKLYYPKAVATDAAGNVYISDWNNNRIREINTSGIINTIIGNGTAGFFGDGGAPLLAEINQSTGVAIGPGGKIYIADDANNRIRVVQFPVTHAPYFTRGHVQNFTFCPTEIVYIDSFLDAMDMDLGQTETWSVVTPPVHGLLFASYSTTSTGSVLSTTGLNYQPVGYVGNDSFKVRIDDGGLADTTTIYIHILPPPNAGVINGIDSICPGDSVLFTDTVSGGTWNTGSASVATVGSTGRVTGVASGVVAISYTVTNLCGSATVTFPLKVRSSCDTVNAVASVPLPDLRIIVTPNPNAGIFTILLPVTSSEELTFTVYNMMGEKVKEFTGHGNRPQHIDLGLPGGIYFISAAGAHVTYTGKVVVTR